MAAAKAIAARVADDELRPEYIVPSVFDRGVAPGSPPPSARPPGREDDG